MSEGSGPVRFSVWWLVALALATVVGLVIEAVILT